jgi:tetratricopeptide (TPR) repeat protein
MVPSGVDWFSGMELKQKLVELLEHAYDQEQVFVQSLSDEDRSAAGTLESWSAKDTIAHIVAWKERAAQVLAALRRGEPGLDFGGLSQFNTRVFQEYQNLPWCDVLERSRQAHRFLREQTQATPDELLVAPEQTEGNDEPVCWFIVGAGCNHSLGHLAQYYIAQGNAALAAEMQEQAAGPLLRLDEGPDWQSRVYYGLAIYYAAAGQTEQAMDALRAALRLNPGLVERAREDPDLTSLREHPEYHSICPG